MASPSSKPLVVVVGVGGVGSHAAHLLVRANASNLRLIDFDQVTLSSLNRHATATREDVGTPKVQALKRALLNIDPNLSVEARCELFDSNSADNVFQGNPALVVDAIDDIKTKTELVSQCFRRKVRLVCSLGAGGKAYATQLRVAQLSEVVNDPIARSMLKLLREKSRSQQSPPPSDEHWWEKLEHTVTCVYSSEKQSVSLLPIPDGVNRSEELGTQPKFRVRILPVLPPVPAAFGAALAMQAIQILGNSTCRIEPDPIPLVRPEYVHKLFTPFRKSFPASQAWDMRAKRLISMDEVAWLIGHVLRGCCALTGARIDAAHRPKFVLCKFDDEKPPVLGNVIFATTAAADALKQFGLDAMPREERERVQRLLDASVVDRKRVIKSLWEAEESKTASSTPHSITPATPSALNPPPWK